MAPIPRPRVLRAAMPISYQCPHCGTQMEILERFAGQTGACAVCSKNITVPALGAAGEAPAHSDRSGAPAASGLSLAATLGFLAGSVGLFCLLLLISVLVVRVAVPAVQTARSSRLDTATLRNLEKIAAALNQYHDDHGTFPPAYLTDRAGKPAHSWRVLILPQLGYEDLFQKYDFNQAWDSDTNLSVFNQMPREYVAPRAGGQTTSGTTHFGVVMGKQTAFPYEVGVKRSQVLDEDASVLAIVEVHGMGFDWTDPASNYDLESPQGTLVIVNEVAPSVPLAASTLTGNVAMLNGETHHLNETVTPQLLRDMSTRSGSEYIDLELDLMLSP